MITFCPWKNNCQCSRTYCSWVSPYSGENIPGIWDFSLIQNFQTVAPAKKNRVIYPEPQVCHNKHWKVRDHREHFHELRGAGNRPSVCTSHKREKLSDKWLVSPLLQGAYLSAFLEMFKGQNKEQTPWSNTQACCLLSCYRGSTGTLASPSRESWMILCLSKDK